MTDGKVDVVLEDWNNIQQSTRTSSPRRSRSSTRGSGVIGHIGWFIPTYLMKQHPEFTTWKGLKGKESLFKSPESGSQGMFLGGDPSYVQKDPQLIKQLGLNFKFVSVGAEPAQVARWTQLYKQNKPVLFYWYTPQYLNTAYQLSEVKLPAREEVRRLVQPEARKRLEHLPLRLRADDHREADQREVREERLAGGRRAQALEVDATTRTPSPT